MKIVLVRHGESESNARTTEHHDSPLTKTGIAQAKNLGIKLKKIKISAIYTSNLKRAKETAEIISKTIHVPIKASFDELNEYNKDNLKSRLKILLNSRLKRLKKLLKSILKDKAKEKTILIVADGITNRMIIGYLLNIPMKKHLLRFGQHNTGSSTLHWHKKYRNWSLLTMNEVSHLPRKLKEDKYI